VLLRLSGGVQFDGETLAEDRKGEFAEGQSVAALQ